MEDKNEESTSLVQQGAADEIPSILLKWQNVNLSVPKGDQEFQILKNISGFANPCEILAIMGSSGSGKTSLLSILTSRIPSSCKFSGELTLNGIGYRDTNPNKYIRYIPQENILYDFLTPRQTLKFFGRLQTSLSGKNLDKKIQKILDNFHLSSVADSIVGNDIIKGLSGGEKKRLSIAIEFVSDPSILVLDEPTSGLDSYIAFSVIELIKNLCKLGVTVIMTIHQPSRNIYEMFDRLLLIQEGKFVYQGKEKNSLAYFNEAGYPIPKDVNPPDFFLKLLNIKDRTNITNEEKEIMERLEVSYIKAESSNWVDMKINAYDDFDKDRDEYSASFPLALATLLWKRFLIFKANHFILYLKIFQGTILAVYYMLIYPDLDYDTTGMEDRYGALIYYMCFCTLLNCVLYSVLVASERNIEYKNIIAGLYSIQPFYISSIIIEIVLSFITTLSFTLIVYWFCNFNRESSSKIVVFFLCGFIFQVYSCVAGLIAGTIAVSISIATFLGPSFSVIIGIYGGSFTDLESLTETFEWLKYLDGYYYLRNALIKNEFEDLDYDDDVNPKPSDRFYYSGEISSNILISLLHVVGLYIVLSLITTYKLWAFKNAR